MVTMCDSLANWTGETEMVPMHSDCRELLYGYIELREAVWPLFGLWLIVVLGNLAYSSWCAECLCVLISIGRGWREGGRRPFGVYT